MIKSDTRKPARVLVVDDNPAIHDDFRKILLPDHRSKDLAGAALAFFGDEPEEEPERLAVDVDSALQGMEALQMVCRALSSGRPYDLAFIDMRMPPGWDGLTTIEKIWEVQPQIQLVICSAYSDYSWNEISTRLDNHDKLLILKKPFDNSEVLQLVSSSVQKQRESAVADARQAELESTVSERTAQLNAVRQDSERLLASIDSILIGINQDRQIERWNPRATSMLKVEQEAAIGRRFEDLPIQWEQPEEVSQFFHCPLEESHERFETMLRTADGQRFCIGFSRYPVLENGAAVGTIILGTDLTEHRLIEQQLAQAQKLESVGQLAAGVAHEINTPMQYVGDNLKFLQTRFDTVSQYLQLVEDILAKHEDDPRLQPLKDMQSELRLKKLLRQVPEAIEESIQGVQQVSSIVRAMKELSHPGSDDLSPVDLNQVLETTMTVSRNEWKYVAEIETYFAPTVQRVPGLRGALAQVFLNLLVNAAHAISDRTHQGADGKGRIAISTYETNNRAVVEIQDTGGGIPPHIQDRIFDPFFTTKEVGRGSGQGLAIAHNVIVTKHRGTITFDVTPGVGTCFRIELPLTTEPTAREQVTTEPTADSAAIS